LSNKVSGKVWELDLDPIDKLVLLALADHADHEGNNVRPGNDLMCAKTGLSERTIGKKIEKFIQLGILIPVRLSAGPGKFREFSLVADHLPRHELFIKRDLKKVEPRSTVHKQTVERGSTVKGPKSPKSRSTTRQRTVEPGSTVPSNPIRPFTEKQSNLAQPTVEPGALTVEPGADSHDKERARVLNRHEPSCEPSEEEAAPPPFDNFADPLSELASAIATVMGLPAAPEGDAAAPINEAASEFLAAGLTPSAVSEFEEDFYRRKNQQGKKYVLTLKILREDLPGWSRANRMRQVASRAGANGAAKETQSLDPQPPRPRVGQWGQALTLLDTLIGSDAVAAWFAPLEFLGVEDAQVRLRCPDAVFRDWIERNYSAQLADALREVGLGGRAVFEIGGLS